MNKPCTKCLLKLPLSEFNEAKKGKFGKASVCKKCRCLYYLSRSKDRNHRIVGHKRCTGCGILKLRSEFHFSKRVNGWLKPKCRECRAKENYNPLSNRNTPIEVRKQREKDRRRKFYKLDFERNKEKYRMYTLNRRALLKKAEGTFSKEEWLKRLEEFNYFCCYCKRKLTIKTATKDHKQPLSKGGSNWIRNIVPACHQCNSGKCDALFYTPKYNVNETKTLPTTC